MKQLRAMGSKRVAGPSFQKELALFSQIDRSWPSQVQNLPARPPGLALSYRCLTAVSCQNTSKGMNTRMCTTRSLNATANMKRSQGRTRASKSLQLGRGNELIMDANNFTGVHNKNWRTRKHLIPLQCLGNSNLLAELLKGKTH